MSEQRVVSSTLEVHAAAEEIFALVADPAEQPHWHGDGVPATTGAHVVEFEEGRRIAWCPAPEGEERSGQVWRWQLTPLGDRLTLVEHTYDWAGLRDPSRADRARSTAPQMLAASIERLASLVQH